MRSLKKDSDNGVPSWLDIDRSLFPDLVVKEPWKAPVWEVIGTEFT
jgi:hypothetical protein